MDIYTLLRECVEKKASDLHVSSGVEPILRIDGEVTRLEYPKLEDNQVREMLNEIMNDQQKQEFMTTLECDFSVNSDELGARFRVNAFMHNRGHGIVCRVIPQDVLSLEQLNAPEIFKKIASKPRGLVLVTGPTGSGKSTTLAAMIDYINKHDSGHLITIEDPIEFVHQSQKCLVNQREVKRDTMSFNNALKASLREDPDYILVGEMRDLETIRLALTAAETGHLVFGTLHTTSAPKTIDRIINVFPAGEQDMIRAMLSESLEAVIAQTLLKRKGGGRVAAHEILLGVPAVRNLIRENKIPQIFSVLQTGQNIGMQTLQQSLNKLVAAGQIDPLDAEKYM